MKRIITGIAVLMMITGLLAGAFAASSGPAFGGLNWGISSDVAQIVMGQGTVIGNRFRMVIRYDSVDYEGHKAMVMLHFENDRLFEVQVIVVDIDPENPEMSKLPYRELFTQKYGDPVPGNMEDAETGTAVERPGGDSLMWKTEDTGIWLMERDLNTAEIRFRQLK